MGVLAWAILGWEARTATFLGERHVREVLVERCEASRGGGREERTCLSACGQAARETIGLKESVERDMDCVASAGGRVLP
jgi:hypothetical protein